jgi:hypothetical protein
MRGFAATQYYNHSIVDPVQDFAARKGNILFSDNYYTLVELELA